MDGFFGGLELVDEGVGGLAAVGEDVDAADEAGTGGQEEADQFGHLVGVAPAALRDEVELAVCRVGFQVDEQLVHRGQVRARRHREDAGVFFRESRNVLLGVVDDEPLDNGVAGARVGEVVALERGHQPGKKR